MDNTVRDDQIKSEMRRDWKRYVAANYTGYDRFALDRILYWDRFQELLERSVDEKK